MLQSLRIRNLALLDEVALDFEAGFTAVTREIVASSATVGSTWRPARAWGQ